MRSRAWAVRTGLVLTVLLAGQLSGRSVGSQTDPYAGIRDLLDRRATAMLEGDRDAFLATNAPAEAAFAERQRLLFDGFHRIGLASYDLALSDRTWPELTTSREVARYGPDAEPHVLHVEERYRLAGYDRQPALEDLYLTFVLRPGGWRVASDTDLDDVTLYSGRKLWEFGPMVTKESRHFLYLSHPDLEGASGRILATAERAVERVDERWPLRWSHRVPILAPSTTEELRRIIQATFDLDVFVAFAYSGIDRDRGWDLNGHRIILNWPVFSRFSDPTQEDILTHELLHVATRELVGPATPSFVDEGIAEWVAGDSSTFQLADEVAEGGFDEELPRDFEFITGPDPAILAAYEESYTVAQFAVDRYGVAAVADFYRLLGEPRVAPGTARYHVGRAMRAAFGVAFSTFEDRWADWVKAEV
jgi:hypothetical protein